MMKIKRISAKKKKLIKILVYFSGKKNTVVKFGEVNTVQYIK